MDQVEGFEIISRVKTVIRFFEKPEFVMCGRVQLLLLKVELHFIKERKELINL